MIKKFGPKNKLTLIDVSEVKTKNINTVKILELDRILGQFQKALAAEREADLLISLILPLTIDLYMSHPDEFEEILGMIVKTGASRLCTNISLKVLKHINPQSKYLSDFSFVSEKNRFTLGIDPHKKIYASLIESLESGFYFF